MRRLRRFERAPHRGGHLRGAFEPAGGIFVQGAGARRAERRRDVGRHGGERRRLVLEVEAGGVHGVLAGERFFTGDHFIDEHPYRVQIGAGVVAGAEESLGRQVRRRADARADVGEARVAAQLGQPEVDEDGAPVRAGAAEHDVFGLDVAMEQTCVVGVLQAGQDVGRDLGGLRRRQRAALELLAERGARQKLHREKHRTVLGLAVIGDADASAVAKARRVSHFAPKPAVQVLGGGRGQDLDGDLAAGVPIARAVDPGHAPDSEDLSNLVTAREHGAFAEWRKGHAAFDDARAAFMQCRLGIREGRRGGAPPGLVHCAAMGRSQVAVLRVSPGNILQDLDRLVELGGAERALDPGATTILKDNISWHFPFPGANTTPWQLEGTIRALSARGFDDQVCVQNRTVVTDAFKGEDLNGYTPIFQAYDIPVRYNFVPEDMSWSVYEPKSKLHVLHDIFPEGIYIPDDFHGKNVVHLPTVKCHIYTTTTGAMKNAFGGLLNSKRHYTHSWIHQTLVDLLKIQKEIHSGLFCVMDGTTAGDGPGPRTMRPVTKNVMLASEDQVAVDAVAAQMMGFDPMSIEYIRLAHEEGLGKGKREDIDVVGDADLADERWGFTVGDNGASMIGDIMWFGPLKRFQKLFFHTPLVNLFVFGSEAYHDYYRWPFRDKKVFDAWRRDTPWGRLFDDYQRRGALAAGGAGAEGEGGAKDVTGG